MKYLLANRIQTPDGTILQSFNRHDCKIHKDAVTDEVYMVDGGLAYQRGFVNTVPAKDMSVYTDDPFELIREVFCWGTYGKDGKQPLTYKPLKTLTDEHIAAILDTQWHVPDHIRDVFKEELKYREQNNCWNPEELD